MGQKEKYPTHSIEHYPVLECRDFITLVEWLLLSKERDFFRFDSLLEEG